MSNTKAVVPKVSLPYVLCVEGNIGSGKSTLLKNLSKAGFTVIPEPVEEIWGAFLPCLYKDMKRWGFCFQMEVMDWFRQLQSTQFKNRLQQRRLSLADETEAEEAKQFEDDFDNSTADVVGGSSSGIVNDENFGSSRRSSLSCSSLSLMSSSNSEMGARANNMQLTNQKPTSAEDDETFISNNNNSRILADLTNTNSNKLNQGNNNKQRNIFVVERSALSAIEIFARNLLDSGFLNDWEFSLLQRFYSIVDWQPKHVLYLRCDPKISCSRIQQRNRDGESNVDPVLIENLHKKHETLFIKNKFDYISSSQNVITVDGTQNAENVLKEALSKIKLIV